MANPHPEITFRVNLELTRTEKFGPNTNIKDQFVLHPTTYQSSPDRGRTEKANFVNTRSGFAGAAEGVNGTEFTLYGEQALYVRNTYVAGDWNDNNPPGAFGLGAILSIVT